MHENILLYVQYLSAKFGIFRGEGPLQIARVSQSVSQSVPPPKSLKLLVASCRLQLTTCNLELATCNL